MKKLYLETDRPSGHGVRLAETRAARLKEFWEKVPQKTAPESRQLLRQFMRWLEKNKKRSARVSNSQQGKEKVSVL